MNRSSEPTIARCSITGIFRVLSSATYSAPRRSGIEKSTCIVPSCHSRPIASRRSSAACPDGSGSAPHRLRGPGGRDEPPPEAKEAIRLLEETVGTLTQTRASITEDRKAAQAAQQRRQEELRIAEARALKEEEARIRAEAEANAISMAKSEARARAALAARAKAEIAARAKAESDASDKAESERRAKLGADVRRGTD